jgi:hypothetical protein
MSPKRRVFLITGLVVALAAAASMPGAAQLQDEITKPVVVPGSFADLQSSVAAVNRPRGPKDGLTPLAEKVVAIIGAAPNARATSMKVFETKEIGPVFIVPTNQGFTVISESSIGTVEGTLGDGNPIVGGLVEPEGQPAYLWGIAIDDVIGVDIAVGDATSAATMVQNGFYWIAPSEIKSVKGLTLRVHLADGTTVAM